MLFMFNNDTVKIDCKKIYYWDWTYIMMALSVLLTVPSFIMLFWFFKNKVISGGHSVGLA